MAAASETRRDVQRLHGFVRSRVDERSRSSDPLVARWARGLLETLDAVGAYALEVPPSGYETRRLLLRLASAYQSHQDFQAHWALAVPRQR